LFGRDCKNWFAGFKDKQRPIGCSCTTSDVSPNWNSPVWHTLVYCYAGYAGQISSPSRSCFSGQPPHISDIFVLFFFGNNPPHISGFFGCRRTTPASKYLGHPLTPARWQDYVSTSVPRAAEEDCSRDRFSARKLPKNIEEGGWRTGKSPIKWALKWENHPTKWRIFQQAMFDYQKVTPRFNDEFTGNHVFYCRLKPL